MALRRRFMRQGSRGVSSTPWSTGSFSGALVVLVAIAATALADAQQMTTPPARPPIHGRVVAAENGMALARVRILVHTTDPLAEPVLTDDDGRFMVPAPTGSASGTIRVTATKPGFAVLTASTTMTDIAARQLSLRMERGAAISGRVVDHEGEPVVSALVAVRAIAGGTEPNAAAPALTDTDDLGEFRIGGLPAGRYTVTTLGAPADERSSLTRLHERLQQDSATPLPAPAGTPSTIDLRAGDEVAGVDLTVSRTAPAPAVPTTAANLPPEQLGTGAIRGRVTTTSGRPLVNATVRVMKAGMAVRFAITDRQGGFMVAGLPVGAFLVQASKTGYVALEYGQTRAGTSGRTVSLRDGEARTRIDIALPGGSAVSGTVVDDRGEPVAGVTVRALQIRAVGDMTAATTAAGVRPRRTDDRGRFRLFGMLPGQYVFSAAVDAGVSSPDPRGTFGYAPIFYPGTPEIEAAWRVPVDVGLDVTDINLVFTPTRTVQVTGFAFGADGQPARSVVMFRSQRSSRIMQEPRQAPVGPDGAFSIANVPPGEYVIQVTSPPGPPSAAGVASAEFGMQYVRVSDVSPAPVTVRASAGATLEGRIVSDGGTPVPDARVWAFPTDFDRAPIVGTGPAGLTALDDGTFRIVGVTGTRRIVLLRAPPGWYLRSATVDGSDALHAPFDFGLDEKIYRNVEVVMASDAAAVTGEVLDAAGTPISDYSVVVFSIDRNQWYRNSQSMKTARPNQDGSFRIDGLPPGDYWAAALDRLDGTAGAGEWQSPELLQTLPSRAERLTVAGGEVRRMRLRLIKR